MQTITPSLGRPSTILVISAHWEEDIVTITGGNAPSLIYDYYGCPEESHKIKYPAAGQPELARKIHQLLRDVGIDAKLDNKRGFDHGLFVPLENDVSGSGYSLRTDFVSKQPGSSTSHTDRSSLIGAKK